MSDFEQTWRLTRDRFDEALAGLTDEQLNYRMHSGTLTLGEMAMHVAGVEVSFISQILGQDLDPFLERLRASATDGVVNEKPFPFEASEITRESVFAALDSARGMTEPVIANVGPEVRAVSVRSALGPMVDGAGAMARLAYHPGYHQGQAHFIKTAPGFPGGSE